MKDEKLDLIKKELDFVLQEAYKYEKLSLDQIQIERESGSSDYLLSKGYADCALDKYREAISLYKKLASHGDAEAQFQIGELYRYKLHSLESAKYAFNKAAEMGHEEARREAESIEIKDSDMIAEGIGLTFGLGIAVFIVAFSVFSFIKNIFDIEIHPLLISGLIVLVWYGFGFVFLTNIIRSLKTGCLIMFSFVVAAVILYFKFR